MEDYIPFNFLSFLNTYASSFGFLNTKQFVFQWISNLVQNVQNILGRKMKFFTVNLVSLRVFAAAESGYGSVPLPAYIETHLFTEK